MKTKMSHLLFVFLVMPLWLIAQPPIITSITADPAFLLLPNTLRVGLNIPITISGEHFIGTSEIKFSSAVDSSFALDVTVIDPNTIHATTPKLANDLRGITIEVTVTTPEGTSPDFDVLVVDTPLSFSPLITSMNPSVGSSTGGTLVTLSGTGFTGTTTVLFGSTPASFTVINDNQIQVITPPGQDFTPVPVTVTTPLGTCPPFPFTYLPAPFPPTHLSGFQVKNKFATQTERINIIRWQAPTESTPPISYRIYRDTTLTRLAGTVSAEENFFEFVDHNRHKRAYSYFIVAVDNQGVFSSAASITIQPED